ncbi:ImmA/IrrE family metallo-endopeptidase [Aeromonas veronii]|uniref:ImmA/IrrE family metallo-endopeptidase n=1 Tax=Aeromonas veronii TaxID=654 RepID=UPI003BA1E452
MERIHSLNLARIRWCCTDRGVAEDELAHELGIAPAAFAKTMAGEAGLTFNQLRNLAAFFGRGVLFFMEPGDVNAEQVHSPQFRTLTNQKPELSNQVRLLIERVEQQRATFLALREELATEGATKFTPPNLSGLSIPNAAKVIRQWLGLTDRNDFDRYRKAIEARGILVFRSNGYHGKWQIAKQSPILGFSLYDPECPVIVVKKQDHDSRQSFTLMHELGHLLLHRTSSIDDDGDLHASGGAEREANAFAGHLLVPDEFLSAISDDQRSDDVAGYDNWLKPQRDAWGVSGEMILRRLLDSGRLHAEDYAAYRSWISKQIWPEKDGGSRSYRSREPIHVFGDGYVRTVLDALNSRRITLAKASNYLDNLKIADLHKLEQYYAGI